MKIIHDCDNTMGMQHRDIDDGMAILYLLGRFDVELLGVTLTFGNSTLEDVLGCTRKLFTDFAIKDIPFLVGAAGTENRGSEAADFLAGTAAENPGEITLLATGSLTNLLGAYQVDADFFNNLHQVVIMGGVTEPLMINGKEMGELNISSDPQAAAALFLSGTPATVITGNLCLQMPFGTTQMRQLQGSISPSLYTYIETPFTPWMQLMQSYFGVSHIYLWDPLAAVYCTNPELFMNREKLFTTSMAGLSKGFLSLDEGDIQCELNVPGSITSADVILEVLADSYRQLSFPGNGF